MVPRSVLETIHRLVQWEQDRWWMRGWTEFARGQDFSIQPDRSVCGGAHNRMATSHRTSDVESPPLPAQQPTVPSIVDMFDTSGECECRHKGRTRIAAVPTVNRTIDENRHFCDRFNQSVDDWRFEPARIYGLAS